MSSGRGEVIPPYLSRSRAVSAGCDAAGTAQLVGLAFAVLDRPSRKFICAPYRPPLGGGGRVTGPGLN